MYSMISQGGVDQLDYEVEALKIEYEQYFMHIIKREPYQRRQKLDADIRRLTSELTNNTGLKFKVNSLIAKYNSYKQYWNRITRMIDEGTYVRRGEGGGVGAPMPVPPPKNSSKVAANSNGNGNVEGLFNDYIKAKKDCKESTKGLTVDLLQKSIEAERKKMKTRYGTDKLDMEVYIKDGTAKISIKPKK